MKQGFSVLALAAVMMIATTSEAKAASGKDEASSPNSDGSDATENPGNLPEYTTFADQTGTHNLKTGGLRYTFGPLPGGGFGFSLVAVEPFRNGVNARYDADSGDVTYETPDGLRVAFTAADEVPGQSTPLARLFIKPNPAGGVYGGSLTTPIVNAVPLSYTRFGTFYASANSAGPFEGHAFVLGEETRANDLPKSGSATYTAAVGGSVIAPGLPPLRLTGSTATFSANFATGTIATGLVLVGKPVNGGAAVALDTLTGIGSISGAKPGFTGLFAGTGSVRGNFSGAFFGPKAVEFGYNFLVGGTSGAGRMFTAIGGVAGSTAIPPPPPPPAYVAFQDLTGIQNFTSAGIWYGIGPAPAGGIGFVIKGVEALGSGVAVSYDTATGNITFSAPNGTSTTFTAANVVASTPTFRAFNKPNPAGGIYGGSLTVPVIGGVPLSYTRFATFFTAGTPAGLDAHAFVFGVQTQASDVPTTGTATYSGQASGSAILATGGPSVSLNGSIVSLAADFSTGTISTQLSLFMTPAGGGPVFLDTLSGIGSLGALKPGFTGSLLGSGTVSGSFSGAFFGPQAAEFGYDFAVGGANAAGTGFTAVGGAGGRKD